MNNRPQFDPAELAIEARQLISACNTGTLSTMSQKQPGFPFGSVCPFATDDSGSPIFLFSSLAVHSKNLRAEPRASLLVSAPSSGSGLQSGRVTIVGTVEEVPEEEVQSVGRRYLEAHPESAQWISFGDFRFYRLLPVDAYYVAGFGKMGWIQPTELGETTTDG